MRWLAAAVVFAVLVGMASVAVNDAPAGQAGYFSVSSADTITATSSIGFISIEAVSGAVGVRVLGEPSVSASDSLIVLQDDILNLDYYTAGKRVVSFALYPGGGATARGYYW